MSTGVPKVENLRDKLSLILDKLFERTVKINCSFCKKEMEIYKTIFHLGGKCCSDECAKAMLR